jgi:hypothetical protein
MQYLELDENNQEKEYTITFELQQSHCTGSKYVSTLYSVKFGEVYVLWVCFFLEAKCKGLNKF